MPRPPSNSSIAASLRPVEGSRPKPPDWLGLVGRDLWINIVASMPAGYFSPCDTPTLAEACRWEEIARALEDAPPALDVRALATSRTQQRAALRTLRLTKQATRTRHATRAAAVVSKPWDRT